VFDGGSDREAAHFQRRQGKMPLIEIEKAFAQNAPPGPQAAATNKLGQYRGRCIRRF
jgi:hypothetical protein